MVPQKHQLVHIWRILILTHYRILTSTMVGCYFPYDRHTELMLLQRIKPTCTSMLDTMHKKPSLLPNSARRILTHRQLLNGRQMKLCGSLRDRLTSATMTTNKQRAPLWLIVGVLCFHIM